MTANIHSFLSNRPQYNPQQTLMVKEKALIVVNKQDLSPITRLKGKMGFGKASHRKVAKCVVKNTGQMESDTHARFNRYVKTKNKGKFFWQKGKTVAPALMITDKISQKNTVDYQAEALFLQVKKIHKDNPPVDQLENLIETINQLSESIQWLDTQDKKGNKPLLEEILMLKRDMKLQWSDDDQLKGALKDLQSAVYKKHFAKRLARMDAVVTQLENRFEMHKDDILDNDPAPFQQFFNLNNNNNRSSEELFLKNKDFVESELKDGVRNWIKG